MTTLEQGFYTLVYHDGQHRTIRVKPITKGPFDGKTILSFKEGTEYVGFGFLVEGTVRFWKKFTQANSAERCARINRAVATIQADPTKHQLAYAMKEGKCARCGRDLTVPASLHAGMGPECAGKGRWTKKDNQAVFQTMQEAVAA